MELASRGRKNVGNGAMVGAVLVRENKIIAQDWHREFGSAHAESGLLNSFTGRIEPEDILYVNLEPCCHQGKTPPCTYAVISRGIKRVCFGMLDPDERVAGKGIETLRSAGIEVIGPIARASCEYFNRGYVSLRRTGRPWITIKEARTRSGMISHDDGSTLKITDEEQDVWSHTFLRSCHDGILVGVETIVRDNPFLNTRFAQRNDLTKVKNYQPWRIILDPSLRIPTSANVLMHSRGDTIVVTSDALSEGGRVAEDALHDWGVRVMQIPLREGSFAIPDILRLLSTPRDDFHGLSSLLVEGGERTWKGFRSSGFIDEMVSLIGA